MASHALSAPALHCRRVPVTRRALRVAAYADSTDVKVLLKVNRRLQYGQTLAAVGSMEKMGKWRPEAALKLQWHDGDVWSAETELPFGTRVEYKYIVRARDGTVAEWQPGGNKVLEVPEAAAVEVADQWEGSQAKVVVTPAPPKPAPPPPAPEPVAVVDQPDPVVADPVIAVDPVPAPEPEGLVGPEAVVVDLGSPAAEATAVEDLPPTASEVVMEFADGVGVSEQLQHATAADGDAGQLQHTAVADATAFKLPPAYSNGNGNGNGVKAHVAPQSTVEAAPAASAATAPVAVPAAAATTSTSGPEVTAAPADPEFQPCTSPVQMYDVVPGASEDLTPDLLQIPLDTPQPSLDHLTTNEMRTELKRRGLPVAGNRRVLISRLIDAGAFQ